MSLRLFLLLVFAYYRSQKQATYKQYSLRLFSWTSPHFGAKISQPTEIKRRSPRATCLSLTCLVLTQCQCGCLFLSINLQRTFIFYLSLFSLSSMLILCAWIFLIVDVVEVTLRYNERIIGRQVVERVYSAQEQWMANIFLIYAFFSRPTLLLLLSAANSLMLKLQLLLVSFQAGSLGWQE